MDTFYSFVSLLSAICHDKKKFVSFNGKVLRLAISDNERAQLTPGFTAYNLKHSYFEHSKECEIEFPQKPDRKVLVLFNGADFMTKLVSFIEEFDHLNICILNFDGSFLLKHEAEKFSAENAFLFNSIQYRLLIQLIGQTVDFTSYWDREQRRFLIFSGDKGPFFIGYNDMEEKVKSLPDLMLTRLQLENAFTKIEFVQFFKDAVIQGIHAYSEGQRFFEMINSLQVLIEISNRDHTIYLRKFGFDKIKAKFKEERIKYFENIEKNIESVSKQVTSFPLTFAASVFAGYQVKDKSFILFLILGAYTLYTIIAWKILNVVAFNRKKIEEDVALEEENIQKGYEMIYDSFKGDFDKIKEKIQRLHGLIILLRIVLISLLSGFAIFCWHQYCH